MDLNNIIELTYGYECSPYSVEEIIGYTSTVDVISAMRILDINVTAEMLSKAANNELLELLELVPGITERKAAVILDAGIICFNLADEMYEEAIDATKEAIQEYNKE